MDPNQTTAPPPPAYFPPPASPGVFGNRIPSTVAFAIGILLFFLPFIDIKCGGMSLAKASGFELATGFKIKNAGGNSLMDEWKTPATESGLPKTTEKTSKKDPNIFAMASLGLGVLGLLLSFANAKTGGGGGIVAGILSAGTLIYMMIDLKQTFNKEMVNKIPDKVGEGADTLELDKLGSSLNDMKPTLEFTPWFWVAVIAFLAAAIFSYMRMRNVKRI